MRFTTSGAAAAMLLASMATAGAQAPPPPPPMAPPMAMGITDWSGFYVGVNVGGAFGTSKLDFRPQGTSTGDFNTRGPFGGGTLGFNWELNNGWLLGLEGDIDGAGIGGSKSCPGAAFNCRASNTWDGTARGRLGWAPGAGNLLWFATGGAAFGDIRG